MHVFFTTVQISQPSNKLIFAVHLSTRQTRIDAVDPDDALSLIEGIHRPVLEEFPNGFADPDCEDWT